MIATSSYTKITRRCVWIQVIAHKLRHMMVNMLVIMMKIISNVSNNVIIIGTNKLNQRKFVLLNYHVMML